MPINGTPGDDHLVGTGADDTFELADGGSDYANGKGGNDTFNLGATFGTGDRLIGGSGDDTVNLDGDYSTGFVFRANSLRDIEHIVLTGGNSYRFTANDANVAAGATLEINGAELAGTLNFNGAAELDGKFTIIGGAGNDELTGGASDDLFNLSHGGDDKANGRGGNNNFTMGAELSVGDRIIGSTSAGANTNLILNGDYDITLQANTIKNIFNVSLNGGHDYRIVFHDGNVAAGAVQFVNSYLLSAGDITIIDGSAETDGRFFMNAGASNDTLIGGAMDDRFTLPFGGDDLIKGGPGDDAVLFTNAGFTAADKINGNNGFDTLEFSGDFSAGYSFNANTMNGVERILVFDGFSYSFTPADGNVAAGETLIVDASGLTGANALTWNGSGETDGEFIITGGQGNDVIRGGAGEDRLGGGLGKDTLEGRGGEDIFSFGAIAHSTGSAYDTISGFRANSDLIDLVVLPNAFDAALNAGTLRANQFDSDLAEAINGDFPGNEALGAGHALLFTPDAGNLAGHTFLLVDANSTAGYQTGADYVIELDGLVGTLGLLNFI